jgi:glutathione S-transferase
VSRESIFKRRLEDVAPKAEERAQEWEKVKKTFNAFAGWYGDDVGEDMQGARKWISGGQPTYPDLVVAALLMAITRIVGEDSIEWREIKEWNHGRWGRLLEELCLLEGGC